MQEVYAYCDESYQDLIYKNKEELINHHFALFGAVKIPKKHYIEFKNLIYELRVKHNVFGELKWSTVSSNKISFYLDLINLFFSYDFIEFKCIIVDCKKIDHKKYNNSDPELGYYKYYYILLINWLHNDSYRLYLDHRTNKYKNRYQEFNRILNKSKNVLSTQPIDSKESDVLQLLNILLGSVAYQYNVIEKKSVAKKELLKLVESKANHGFSSSPLFEDKFNIFIPHLKGRK